MMIEIEAKLMRWSEQEAAVRGMTVTDLVNYVLSEGFGALGSQCLVD